MKKLFIFFLLAIGIFFRAYQPGLYVFGFDQVQILSNAELIKQGNITLIGPRTGPAEMFTGPLIYYITAFFLFFIDSPWAIVATSTLIAAITGLSLFLLFKKYISAENALVVLLIWTFSPFLIRFDRIAWNPDLTLLASSLVFFPMLGYMKQKMISNLDILLIFIGSFLGFQAHFSGLLLPAMLFLTLIVFKKLSMIPLIASGLGLISSILPSIIFDYRHGWLNVKGLVSFLSEKETIGGTLFFGRFVHAIKASLEILGSFMPFELEREVSIYLGLLLLTVVLWQFFKRQVKNYTNTAASLLWVLVIVVIFSFYRSNAPEYYFFIFLPALFIIASDFISSLSYKKQINQGLIILVISVLSIYSISNFNSFATKNGSRISNQLNIAKDISTYNNLVPVSKIAYDILEVDTIGMRYFVDGLVTLSDLGQTVHIATTEDHNSRYNQYGLWADPRVSTDFNYIVSSEIVLKMPSNINLLQDKTLGTEFGSNETFQIVADNQLTGDLIVVVKQIGNPFISGNEVYPSIKKAMSQKETEKGWKAIDYQSYKGYLKEYENYLLVYVTNKTSSELFEVSAQSIKPGILR